MRESDLLRHIYARSAGVSGPGDGPIIVGPGDDCAVIRGDGLLLVTVDQLVEGRHFLLSAAGQGESGQLDRVARKALARSVSDIAAMGGRPMAALAAACYRQGFGGADQLFDAMHRWAAHWGCPLIGGDIATHDGPLVLSVTVIGTAHEARGPVLRSGARVGDAVYITGRLGGSLESGRHMDFEPRTAEGQWLAGTLGERLHAMMDISDGLGRDGGRMAEASGVRIEIESSLVPRHHGVPSWERAVSDGEDYELLFTADPEWEATPTAGDAGALISRIGSVVHGSGCVVRSESGAWIEVGEHGWEHGA